MSEKRRKNGSAGKCAKPRRLEEIYQQEVRLPEGLEDSLTPVSCLSWREGQQVYLVMDGKQRLSILKRGEGAAAGLLRAEAENLRSASFSFLPRFIAQTEEDGIFWLQREYIPGDTLWEIVERRGPLPGKEAGELLCRLCELAGQLHNARPPVICRDIKPQNIVLTPEGNLFLIDFGTAREYREEAPHDTVFVGTRQTAAPEQYGYRQTDCRTDIYALGVVYLYLLTGSLDVQKRSVKNLLSPQTTQIIEKCTRLDPEERYQSCPELRDAIRGAAGPVTERVKKKIRRRWELLAAGAACIAVILGCFAYVRGQNKPYEFHSELIGEAVREQLGREYDEPVTKGELAQIGTLRICGWRIMEDTASHSVHQGAHTIDGDGDNETVGPIFDLTDCSYMTGLRTLVLDRQHITDISPLQGLSLEYVSLCGNEITDLSPLRDMESLQTVYVNETEVSDLSALAGKTALTALGIADTRVEDLSPLAGLNIEKLDMTVPSGADWDLLTALPLKTLAVHSYSEELEEKLGTIATLEEIYIYGYQHTTLEPLLNLKNLTVLDVYWGNAQSLEGIGALKNLSSLNLAGTQVSDLTPLRDNQRLVRLNVEYSRVTDFAPLAGMEQLGTLGCSASQKEALERVIAEPWFEIIEYEDEPAA